MVRHEANFPYNELITICCPSTRLMKDMQVKYKRHERHFVFDKSMKILTCVYGYRSKFWLGWDFIDLRDHVEAQNPILFKQPYILNAQ